MSVATIIALALGYVVMMLLALCFFIVGGRSDTTRNVGDDHPEGDCPVLHPEMITRSHDESINSVKG